MAFEFYKQLQQTANAFGLRSNRATVSDQVDLENKLLLGATRKRELSQPSAAERWAGTEERSRTEFLFSSMIALAKDPNTPDDTRTNIQRLVEKGFYGLTNEQRGVLLPTLAGSWLDPEEQKIEYWNKNYGHTKPVPPEVTESIIIDGRTVFNKSLLPQNEETEATWANYLLKTEDYNYKRELFLHGAQKAEPYKPSEYVQVLSRIGEGDNERSGDYWSIDRKTGQIKRTPSIIASGDLKKYREWGYTEEGMMARNFIPDSPPMNGTYKGQSIRVASGTDLQGNPKTDMQIVGEPKIDYDSLGPFRDAFGYMIDGTKVEDIANPEAKLIVDQLGQWTGKNLNEANYGEVMASVNEWKDRMFPDVPFQLGYALEGQEHPFGRSNMIEFDGTNWTFIPATRTVTFEDGSPTGVTLYYDSNTKTTSDATGQEVPGVGEDPQDGDPLPTDVIKKPEPITESKFKQWIEALPSTEFDTAKAKAIAREKEVFDKVVGAIVSGHVSFTQWAEQFRYKGK